MTGLTVEQPGPRTTVQDAGRSGFQHQGLSPGGAADLRSYRWANHLLDNAPGAACLEITLGGFHAVAGCPLVLALTGADCKARVNGAPVCHWGVFLMEAGDRLQLDTPKQGLLTYLAVAGGWQTRSFCGSRSVVVREGLEGLGPVAPGQQLPAAARRSAPDVPALLRRRVPMAARLAFTDPITLRIVAGPDWQAFEAMDILRFIHTPYRISQQSDRMGYRLDGPALASPGGITSRGVSCGAVQVPGDGRPMVLLNDRQTIGGYPVLGTVPRLDCSALAQCRPGSRVSFTWADVADCQGERMMFEHSMRTLVWTPRGTLQRGQTDR
ncbi:MAG: biotin-dependent carboxyltransferase family protein [Marinobacter sp.]